MCNSMSTGGETDARAFYVDLLGFEECTKPPELVGRGGVWFRSGAAVVHLGVEADFRPARKAHPAFRCSEYAALVEALLRAGRPIIPDNVRLEGRIRCYTADPFGNRIELIDG